MATLIDDFNRANSADVGAAWTPQKTGQDAKIASNAFSATTVASEAAEQNSFAPGNAQFTEGIFASIGGAVATYGNAYIRAAAPVTFTAYLGTANGGTGKGSAIVKRVDSADTTLLSEGVTAWSGTDKLTLTITAGGDLNLYRNGNLLLGPVNDVVIGAGKTGLEIYISTSGNLTDLTWDWWRAGDLADLTTPITVALSDDWAS